MVGGGVVLGGGGAIGGFEVLVEAVEGPARSGSGGLDSAMVAARELRETRKSKKKYLSLSLRQYGWRANGDVVVETRASLRDALWRFAESKIIDGLRHRRNDKVKVAHDSSPQRSNRCLLFLLLDPPNEHSIMILMDSSTKGGPTNNPPHTSQTSHLVFISLIPIHSAVIKGVSKKQRRNGWMMNDE